MGCGSVVGPDADCGLGAQTFSQVLHVHDLALSDPAHVAPEVLLQLLLLPELLKGPPGLGLLPLLGEFPEMGEGRQEGRKEERGEGLSFLETVAPSEAGCASFGLRCCLGSEVALQVAEGSASPPPPSLPSRNTLEGDSGSSFYLPTLFHFLLPYFGVTFEC